MITEKINQQIEQVFINELQDKYYLVYVDYNDSFNYSADIVQECMDKKDAYPLFEKNDEWISDCQYDVCTQYIDELKDRILSDSKYTDIHPYINEWIDDDDNRDLVRYSIYNRDHSAPYSELIDRTRIRARVTQHSNYDTLPSIWASNYTYVYSEYFKDIVDTLFLNPAKVKKALIEKGITATGTFPNLAYRNGKEVVEYSAFANELNNQCCYAQLVFMGMLPLKCLYDNRFEKYQRIIIPKGNSCGLFNFWNGGGSLLEMELQRDLTLPIQIPRKTQHDYFELCVDERNCNTGYCIDEVYGLIREAWGKEFQLVYQ